MRIALVTEYYYPHLGGITEHVQNLALQFSRLGHRAIIITSHMGEWGQDEPFVYRVGRSQLVFFNGSFARFTIGFQLKNRLTEILQQEQIDLVHVHPPLAPTLGLIASWAARHLGIPVVGTFHSWFPRSYFLSLFHGIFQHELDKIDAKIAVSEPAVQALSRYFKGEWDVIPNGVDVGYFHPNGRHPEDAFIQGPRLLFLGRLDPRNGLSTILEAMPRILHSYPQAQLNVVGDGPLRKYYDRLARPLGKSVRFVGYVYDERPDFYGDADLYLCPATRASFGVTLLEAMACGTPLVVSDIIGFRELVNGGKETVLVRSPKKPEAWARTIIELISNPRRRAEMALAGLLKAKEYAWPKIAKRVLDVYERVGP
jgi:phosphatidylinositol alpha-mannosyltransferase